MTKSAPARVLLFILLLLQARCQCIVSEYQIMPRQRDTGVFYDAGPEDAAVPDRVGPDTSVPTDAALDAARPDTLLPDGAQPDLGQPDLGAPDTLVADSRLPDTLQTDTSQPDVAGMDTLGQDGARPDTSLPDTAAPDTLVEDAGPEDAAAEDGCTPSCAGRCGGAADGCGGTCTGACPLGQWCSSQACLLCDVADHCGLTVCLECSTQPTNKACYNRACGCADDDDCALGQWCDNNSCADCNTNTACGLDGVACVDCSQQTSEKVCINRACGCGIDDDCAIDEWCDNGSCAICDQDFACGDGVDCVDCSGLTTNKVCVNRACGCTGDGDCAQGQWCNGGSCADCDVAAHCGDVGEACVNCAGLSQNKACVNRACGCTDAAAHCFSGQICNASDLCEGNVNQCSTGEHDCNPCSEDCVDAFDPNEPPGWTCACKTGFTDDGGGCSYDVSSPPAVTFDTSGVHNISTEDNLPARSCADAPSYSVVGLAASSATLSAAPAACCLNRGDEVMLINLQGYTDATETVGHWELLEVAGVSSTTVSFKAAKSRFYGSGASDDSDIGTAAGQQRVMLLRVPRYGAVTIDDRSGNPSLTANGWDGFKGGVLAARMSSLTLDGVISMSGKGYSGGDCGADSGTGRAQQGESIAGVGISGGSLPDFPLAAAANFGGGGGGCYDGGGLCAYGGGGGGYGAAGDTQLCSSCGNACDWDSEGGQSVGWQNLSPGAGHIFLGSGGGGGGFYFGGCSNHGGAGGGAVIFLISGDLVTNSTETPGVNTFIYADGVSTSGTEEDGGSGAGGSIYIEVNNVNVWEPSLPFYARGGTHSMTANGGDGRIHFDCSGICVDSVDAVPTPYTP